jgi:serine protease Do
VTIQSVTPDLAQAFGLKESKGALVAEVAPEGPAAKAGIKTGDVILSYGGKQLKSSNDLPRLVAETPVGRTVEVIILRDKKELRLSLKVEELTEQRAAAQSAAPAQSFGMQVEGLSQRTRQQYGISEKSGVVVVSVEQGSAADEAGIQAGDVITQVNKKPVNDVAQYNAALKASGAGAPTLFLLKRNGQTFFVTIEGES